MKTAIDIIILTFVFVVTIFFSWYFYWIISNSIKDFIKKRKLRNPAYRKQKRHEEHLMLQKMRSEKEDEDISDFMY